MTEYFYTSFLPSDFGSLSKDKSKTLPAKIAKYLYITSLSRILTSLEKSKQIEFFAALERSEREASIWIRDNELSKDILKEHLERTLLSLRAR